MGKGFYPAMGTPSGTRAGVKGCAMVGTSSGTLTGAVGCTIGYPKDLRDSWHTDWHSDLHGRLSERLARSFVR